MRKYPPINIVDEFVIPVRQDVIEEALRKAGYECSKENISNLLKNDILNDVCKSFESQIVDEIVHILLLHGISGKRRYEE